MTGTVQRAERGAFPGRDLSSTQAWRLAGVLFSLYFLAQVDRLVITVLIRSIIADLGLTEMQAGLILGPAFALCYAVFGLVAGALVDRYSRRLIICAGVFVWAVATIACGLADSFERLFAARIFVGLGEATLAPAAYSLLADAFQKSRLTTANALFNGGALSGGAAGIAFGGLFLQALHQSGGVSLPVIGDIAPWRTVFLAAGAPGLVMAFLIFATAEPPRRSTSADKPGFTETFAFIRRRGVMWLQILFGFAAMNTILNAFMAWQAALLMGRFQLPPGQAGPLIAMMLVGFGVTGQLAGGRIVDRFLGRGVIDAHLLYYARGLPFLGPVAVAAFFMPNVMLFLVFAAVIYAYMLTFMPCAAGAIQLATPPELRGKMIAVLMLVTNLVGYLIGPTAVAYFSESVYSGDNRLGMAMATVIGVAAVAAFVFLSLGAARLRRYLNEAAAPA